MTMDNALNGSQSNARALKLSLLVQALKCTKEFVHISHIKPGTIVAHKIHGLSVMLFHPQFYDCLWTLTGKFPCITE